MSDIDQVIESGSILVWSNKNRLIKTSEGWIPYEVKEYPYLLGLLRSIQDPDVDRVIIQAGTQVGKTEGAISALFWFLLQKQVNCLYMLPHQSALSDFSSSRLSPIIENSPRIKAAFSKVDNVRLKTTVQGQSLYLRAAGAAEAQMEEFSISALFRDEFAHYGDKVIELSEKRLGSAKNPKIIDLGHPLYSGNRLSEAYGESSQFEWHYQCPKCTKTHKVDFFKDFYDRGGELGCPKCGQDWTKEEILKDGDWKAMGSEDNPVHGYRIPRTLSPNQDLAKMAQKYENSQSQGGTRIAIFNQTYLAQEFSASGQTLSPGEVRAVMTGPSTASVEPLETYLGVDVGKPLYYAVMSQEGNVLAFGKAESYDELTRVRERWDATVCALDAAPEYHKSREWVEDLPPQVRGWLVTTKGRGQVHEPKGNLEKKQIQIHQVESFDRLFEAIRKKKLQLPGDAPAQIIEHFTDPVKLIEEDTPSIEKGDSHYCDSVRYAQAARQVMGTVPTPEREKVFDEFQQKSHLISEVPPIKGLTVGINITEQGDYAFLLAGLTPKNKLIIAREKVYDGARSLSDYKIFKEYGKFVERCWQDLRQKMSLKTSHNYLTPRILANDKDFAAEASKHRDLYANKTQWKEDVEPRTSDIKGLLDKSAMDIHNSCERLINEIDQRKWNQEGALLLPALANILEIKAKYVGNKSRREDRPFTNKEKARRFFHRG